MIFGIILAAYGEEESFIRSCLSELTALHTDEKLEMKTFARSSLLLAQLEGENLLDIAVVDVTLPGALESARRIRARFRKAEILVVADVSVSPVVYIHPSIRASSLLLRPATEEWRKTIRDFYSQLSLKNNEKKQDVLWVENRDGIFRIPFAQIYYLEARDKKVFIRVGAEEFGVNSTIERFAGQLPQNFVRCHRSFIVNMDYVTRIRRTENLLYLGENLFVPVSRSYKDAFKRNSGGGAFR